jgi:maleate isomerase
MTVELKELPFETDTGFGSRARIGLIVLENDQTVEAELATLWPEGVAAFATRIPMEDRVTAESLLAMETRIPEAAGLLPEIMGFDVIGYGCTSAATLIGEERVSAALHRAHPKVANTNPISAVLAAMEALGARRIAVITPYNAQVTTGIVSLLEERGLDVAAAGSFLEESDATVARITETAVADAVREMVANSAGDLDAEALDAVFVSCTSLRAYGVAADLESELGVAVVSSNLAFGWHLLRLAGINDQLEGLGRLFSLGLER